MPSHVFHLPVLEMTEIENTAEELRGEKRFLRLSGYLFLSILYVGYVNLVNVAKSLFLHIRIAVTWLMLMM
jgi:hypothetical protein